MTLEFEQLAPDLEHMVQELSRRQNRQQEQRDLILNRLIEVATSWDEIISKMELAKEAADMKYYRAAVPLHHSHPLNRGIPPAQTPREATIIACDGSQIVPDRHAPFLYYLINTGTIAYYHGNGRPPDIFSQPTLKYPGASELDEEDLFTLNSALVNLWRDQFEIEALESTLKEIQPHNGPRLAVLDQRLLYWPASGLPGREGQKVVEAWQQAMTGIRQKDTWLAGYIDRPGKRSILTMLHSLEIDQPEFKINSLYRSAPYTGLSDIDLYDSILEVGQRSPVFVDISMHNDTFRARDEENEICFFYLRTGEGPRELARVDIPMWVARDEATVSTMHALLYDQCTILGSYPYVITRADEIAVVGRRDQEELENRIALRLAEIGMDARMTAKQRSKGFARGVKTRHERL